MALAEVLAAGFLALFAAISSIQVLRRRLSLGPTHSAANGEDDDSEHDASAINPTEKAALIQDGDESLSKFTQTITYLLALVGVQQKTRNPKLMQRKSKGTKKIHKPSFYPLLDETATWFAEWEGKKRQAQTAVSPVPGTEFCDDARIEKGTHLVPPDLLDYDGEPAQFRPSLHVVIPVGAI